MRKLWHGPALLSDGEIDTMWELLTRETPGSTLTLIEGVGHHPLPEAPDRWVGALRQRLDP